MTREKELIPKRASDYDGYLLNAYEVGDMRLQLYLTRGQFAVITSDNRITKISERRSEYGYDKELIIYDIISSYTFERQTVAEGVFRMLHKTMETLANTEREYNDE